MSEVSVSTENPGNPNEENNESVAMPSEKPESENSDGAKLGNDDVQRAIEGLAEIPDDQLQEFLNDEDFMEGLDVVDAWDGDDSKRPDSKDAKDRDHSRSSRERARRDRRRSHSRDRLRRDERRRDDVRRDPSKSSKDIERDKMRMKKDTASKILAEKEKAIKNLLDSDEVVPPGTEVEVIQDINDKQQHSERAQMKIRRSRERRRSLDRRGFSPSRRRSSDRIRLSPNRRGSPDRRHLRFSPERRRNVVSPIMRKSWERRASRDRSLERHRRREEREMRLTGRRSRSRGRQRSRSVERYRKRYSRSPNGRRPSPRRSRSRSPDRRARKRSPFINEIARQFGKEGLIPGGQQTGFLPGIPPLMGPNFPQDQVSPVPPPSTMQQFMHHPGPPVPPPPGIHMPSVGQPFPNFELGPPMNFEPGRVGPLLQPSQTEFSSGPVMYNQGNPGAALAPPMMGPPILPMPIPSPQPVPAPGPSELTAAINFAQNRSNLEKKQLISDGNRPGSPVSSRIHFDPGKSSAYNGAEPSRSDRLKTPEPPVISNSKPFEKTSLSSLLEASVSAKDSHGPTVLYPGFKPEIMRQCEQALRELPAEDMRLKMKGRFFFDPSKEEKEENLKEHKSNSILLRSGRTRLFFDEQEKTQSSSEPARPFVETHQKICQTDTVEIQSVGVQVTILPKTAEFGQQLYYNELQNTMKEEKRPIMDRLDWNIRETFEYGANVREADDLRCRLRNSSQKQQTWNRGHSPSQPHGVTNDRRIDSPGMMNMMDHGSRGINVPSGTRSRDNYSFGRTSREDHYSTREPYSPTYRQSIEPQDPFHDARSNHSRGESPMALDESPEEIEVIDEESYTRNSDWRSRGSSNYGNNSALNKLRAMRGKPSGRPYRGRGHRGKY